MTTPTKTTMKTMKTPAAAIRIALLLSLSGCFSLGRGAPAPTYYVLGGGSPAVAAPPGSRIPAETGSDAIPAVGLRSPELADYLATSHVVVRRGSHRVGFSEFERWGEDLGRGIARTLTGAMAARASGYRVTPAPWSPNERPGRLVHVRILRFEGAAPADTLATAGEAHLLANWRILDAEDDALLHSGTTEVRSPWVIGDTPELVALLDAALGTLAEDLVRALERPRTPPGSPDPP